MLDGTLPLADVCHFFQVPLPAQPAASLSEWLGEALIAGADQLVWHGVVFEVQQRGETGIARVRVTMERRPG